MYETNEVNFDWKGFLLKLAFVIIVIILIVKLLPLDNYKKTNQSDTEQKEIFENNLSSLKKAGSNYFTADKLPAEEGEIIKLTLDELIKVGAIRTLRDSEGETCDLYESYIQVEKKSTNFELETYLSCEGNVESTFMNLTQSSKNPETIEQTEDCECETTTTKVKSNSSYSYSYNYSSSGSSSSSSTVNYVTSKVVKTTKKASKVMVIFNSNGGSSVNAQSVNIGDRAYKPTNPVREGYNFIGWYHNGTLYNFSNSVNSNIILVAKWERINYSNPGTTKRTTTHYVYTTSSVNTTTAVRYKVYFDSKGGTYKSTQNVIRGNYSYRPTDPVKRNAEFIGWYWNNKPFDFNTRIYSNITLVAKYRETQTSTTYVYSAGWGEQVNHFGVTHTLAIPSSLANYAFVRIKSVDFERSLSSSTDDDLYNYDRLHRSTFEYVYNNYDYTSGVSSNLARINYANVYKLNSSTYNRQVRWEGNVSNQCSTPFNYLFHDNSCIYGILYKVTWEYEVDV